MISYVKLYDVKTCQSRHEPVEWEVAERPLITVSDRSGRVTAPVRSMTFDDAKREFHRIVECAGRSSVSAETLDFFGL